MNKKIIFCVLSALTCCFSEITMAQENKSKNNVQLLFEMNTQQRKGNYLEAIAAATQILVNQPDMRLAINFVHNNYERTDQQTKQTLATLTDIYHLPTAEKRCEIYRLLTIINENLAQVPMPLRGANDSWIWQPEIVYYQGHWNEARNNVFKLLMVQGKNEMDMHEMESAKETFLRAINYYLVSEEEQNSNTEYLINKLVTTANELQQTKRTSDAIYAYDIYTLASKIDTLRTDVDSAQMQARVVVAACYANQAAQQEKSTLVTDMEAAYENYRNAQDWHETASTAKKMENLRKRIAAYFRKKGEAAEQNNQPEQAEDYFRQAEEWQ